MMGIKLDNEDPLLLFLNKFYFCICNLDSNFVSLSKLNLQVQQTPKPLAQDPDEVPPLLVHSDLQTDEAAVVTDLLSKGTYY